MLCCYSFSSFLTFLIFHAWRLAGVLVGKGNDSQVLENVQFRWWAEGCSSLAYFVHERHIASKLDTSNLQQ
jgi:hypothetical protein